MISGGGGPSVCFVLGESTGFCEIINLLTTVAVPICLIFSRIGMLTNVLRLLLGIIGKNCTYIYT